MNDEKNSFSFKPVKSEEVLKTIYYLKNNKGSLSYTIPVKILKMFSGSFVCYLITQKYMKKYFSTKSMTT